MKRLLLSICLVGCLKPIPPVPEPPRVIAVIEVPEQPPMVIYEEPDAGPPIQTWLTGEALQKVLEERERQNRKCDCQDGDPLCECLE
jgi:hypothetical protein